MEMQMDGMTLYENDSSWTYGDVEHLEITANLKGKVTINRTGQPHQVSMPQVSGLRRATRSPKTLRLSPQESGVHSNGMFSDILVQTPTIGRFTITAGANVNVWSVDEDDTRRPA